MSEMEIFHGYFEESDLDIKPSDDDDFYDLEESHNCYYVVVESKLYRVWRSDCELDVYGFTIVLPETEKKQLLLYWYNGGAVIREVAAIAIKRHLDEKTARTTHDCK